MSLDIVILAAGQGTRMRSALPKVLHPVAGKPMLGHVIDTARALAPRKIHVVIGHGAERVRERGRLTLQGQESELLVRWIGRQHRRGECHAGQKSQQEQGPPFRGPSRAHQRWLTRRLMSNRPIAGHPRARADRRDRAPLRPAASS